MSAGQGDPTQTARSAEELLGGESRGDRRLRQGLDVTLVLIVIATIALVAWTVIRLDARGERLNDALATRQAGCVCVTPTP